jgi:hypothetical protein
MSSPPIPNNLGPTLLLVAALLLLPLGVGVPLLLLSLARMRTWQGQPAFPRLRRGLGRLIGARPPVSWAQPQPTRRVSTP